MNTKKLFGCILMVLLCSLAISSAAAAIPVTINRVEIDDQEIRPDHTNRLDIVRGETVDFEITLEASQDVDDVELMVMVSGFEHNEEKPLVDKTGPFDLDKNIRYRKNLKIAFPKLVEEDNYKVRVILTDRNGVEEIKNYNVRIDVPRHDLQIVDAIFTPSRRVQAGQALLSVVRVENFGEKDEQDVKITASIPALGVSVSDYIDEIESEEEEETEEMYLKIPQCAKPGVYDLNIAAQYNDGADKTEIRGSIEVLENPSCNEQKAGEKAEVQLPPAQEQKQEETVEAVPRAKSIRTALEITLLALVGLLVLVGLVIGFTKMGKEE